MENAKKAIAYLKDTLLKDLDLSALHSRSPTAHKWKAPYRSMQLREVVYWRIVDLLDQAVFLHERGHILGARIILRSSVETLAILIYLNQQMAKVLDGSVGFYAFSDKTETLLLGSKDGSTPVSAINILTVLDSCDKKYKGIRRMYDRLSESSHPNYGGMSKGYTSFDHAADAVKFYNRWSELYEEKFESYFMLCIDIFTHEYDKVWVELFERLEAWIASHDKALEAKPNFATQANQPRK